VFGRRVGGEGFGFMRNNDILRNSVGLVVCTKRYCTQIMEMSVALNCICRGKVRNVYCPSYQAP